MGDNTKIQWCDHTFNSWWGCTKVANDPACHNCYAEAFSKRVGFKIWGDSKDRRHLGDDTWKRPLKWDADAARDRVRRRVFCASMADVFEDRRDLDGARERLWDLVDATPNLDWLLLTKRPKNIERMLGPRRQRENIWLGTTAVTQRHLDERVPILLECSARNVFVSVEPQMEPIMLSGCVDVHLLDWVICGGESGPKARPFQVDWARELRDECRSLKIAFFMKQMGGRVIDRNDIGFNYMGSDEPSYWPESVGPDDVVEHPNGFREDYQGAPVRIRLKDAKGGDPSEWPEDLRVREFPE